MSYYKRSAKISATEKVPVSLTQLTIIAVTVLCTVVIPAQIYDQYVQPSINAVASGQVAGATTDQPSVQHSFATAEVKQANTLDILDDKQMMIGIGTIIVGGALLIAGSFVFYRR